MIRYPASLFLALALLLAAPAIPARAGEGLLDTLAIRNQGPLAQLHGLPAVLDARQPQAGRLQTRLLVDVASNYADHATDGEELLFDGETDRVALVLNLGLPRDWSVGLEVPWVSHRGGFLDSFIENWHDIFSLPQGGRDLVSNNRLTYRYRKDGITLLDLQTKESGLGDVALNCAWQPIREDGPNGRALALGARLELPTGDADRLLGSGGTDLALWLAGSARTPFEGGTLAAHMAIGMLAMSRGDVLADQQRPLAAFGRFGFAWGPTDWIAFKVQLDGHSPLYEDSAMDELDAPAALLTLGGTLGLPADLDLDLGVTEDVAVNTAPDVTFHVALNRSF